MDRTWPVRRSLASAFGRDVDDSFRKGLRGFLGEIVPDATLDGPVRILPGEFFGIGGGLGMRCAVACMICDKHTRRIIRAAHRS